MISYNICAIIILAILIISTFFRKMMQGTDGRVLMVILLTAFLTACIDTATISMDNLAVISEAGSSLSMARTVFHTLYLLLRNAIAPFYVIYMVAISDRWHIFAKNGVKVGLFSFPYLFVLVLMIANLFSGVVFYIDENLYYTAHYCKSYIVQIHIAVNALYIRCIHLVSGFF